MRRPVPACIWGFQGFEHCLSLQDLAILSATRKDWQEPLVALYSSPIVKQLVCVLEATVPGLSAVLAVKQRRGALHKADYTELLHQLWAVVSLLHQHSPWGPAMGAAPGLLAGLGPLFTVPHLPEKVAEYFMQRMGVCISYQQLLTAARNRVAGVEVWMNVQHKLQIQSDIPEEAIKACHGDLNPLEMHLGDQIAQVAHDVIDILQLLLNQRPTRTALDLANALLPKITDQAVLQQLLLTAVTRQHDRVIWAALKLPAVRQLGPAAVLELMQADAAVCGRCWYYSPLRRKEGTVMHMLVRLPMALRIASPAIQPLLEAAMVRRCECAVKALCTLPAAKWLPIESLVELLMRGVVDGLEQAVIELCRVPTARHMVSKVIKDCLCAAAVLGRYQAATAMCDLPGTNRIPAVVITNLIEMLLAQAAYTSSLYDWYDAAEGTETVLGCCKLLDSLAKMSAVRSMSSTKLLELFDILVRYNKFEPMIDFLSDLPAARIIPADIMLQRLQQAIQQQDARQVTALCRLPAALGLDVDTVLELVTAVDRLDCSNDRSENSGSSSNSSMFAEMLGPLCYLAGRLGPASSQLKQLMLATISSNQSLFFTFFDESSIRAVEPAARQLTADDVAELLVAAVKQNNADNVESILKDVRVARTISSSVWAEAISHAIDIDVDDEMLDMLCQLPVAKQLTIEEFAALLDQANQAGNSKVLRALMRLRPRRSERIGQHCQGSSRSPDGMAASSCS